MSIKQIVASVALAFSAASASASFQFFDQARTLGCGVITQVRNVPQEPLYDSYYEAHRGGKGSVAGTAGQLAGNGVIGFFTGLAASVVIDTVRGPAEAVNNRQVLDEDKNMADAVSIQLTMDDGRVLNLPFLKRTSFNGYDLYEVGSRFVVFYFEQEGFKSFQLGRFVQKYPPGHQLYKPYCDTRVPADQAQEAFRFGANLAK